MPRPNRPRSVRSETNLARRVAHEREQREMTYEGLAKRMTDAGCPIQPSAIYKIEKADPPRRITVDELVAFADVFGVPAEQLLLPPEVVESEALLELLVEWEVARRDADRAKQVEAQAFDALRQYTADRDDLSAVLQRFIRHWVETWAEEPDVSEAYWMWKFTGAKDWSDKVRTLLNDEAAPAKKKAASRG